MPGGFKCISKICDTPPEKCSGRGNFSGTLLLIHQEKTMETPFKQNLHPLTFKLDLSPRKSKLNLPQWGEKLILWLTGHCIRNLLNENRLAHAKASSLSTRLSEAEQKIHLLEQSQTHLRADLVTALTHLKRATMAHKDAERKLDALKCSIRSEE